MNFELIEQIISYNRYMIGRYFSNPERVLIEKEDYKAV